MKHIFSLLMLAMILTASGTGTAPKGVRPPQARAMARRAAILNLQKNLLRQYSKVKSGPVKGAINHVEITEGEWDGKTYTVKGQLKVSR